MHSKEASKEGESRYITEDALSPVFIRAEGADLRCILEAEIGLPRMPYAEKEAPERLMGAASGKQPSDFIAYPARKGFEMGDTLSKGLRGIVYEGWNHPDLSVLGPGDKSVILVWHSNNSIKKERPRIPGP